MTNETIVLVELHFNVPAREIKEEEETNLHADTMDFWPNPNAVAIAAARNRHINAIDDDECDI